MRGEYRAPECSRDKPGGNDPLHRHKSGYRVLDLSGGLCGARKSGNGFFLCLAEALEPVAGVPVMVTGGLGDPHLADRVIREGTADLAGVGRALLKDPDWAVKARALLSAQ